ncbi:hypothetical protein KKB64_01615 [Patescibacteria group bacterium]|nr:hypothetical protein [Patescibacteria group bacterium]MBU1472468.1 hypothetical protein [Patescibacteria group bacterium]MBU2460282.1 hypothetical protein [Patescibacteria group bacterium]MBU2544609.1 hypothetical protein [Patescibacteria group bacterium]
MNKDALLATLIGFGIGLLIMGLLLVGPNLSKSLPHIALPNISLPKFAKRPSTAPSPTPTIPQSLTIDSPLPDSIELENSVLVSGSASPGSVVVIQGLLDETAVTPTDDGKFAGEVLLKEGVNELIITMHKVDEATSQSVSVYYTQEEF